MDWFDVKMKAKKGEIYIYGEICGNKCWDEDVVPTELSDKLNSLKSATEVSLFVNSPGGSVFAGMAIYNLIARFPKRITAYVDGLAASIASVIVMAADSVWVSATSMLMIHNPSGVVMGEAHEMRKTALLLDKVKGLITDVYVKKTGLPSGEIETMMDDETWMGGKEAFSLNFADEIDERGEGSTNMVPQTNGSVLFNGLAVDVSGFKSFPGCKEVRSNKGNILRLKDRLNFLKNNK